MQGYICSFFSATVFTFEYKMKFAMLVFTGMYKIEKTKQTKTTTNKRKTTLLYILCIYCIDLVFQLPLTSINVDNFEHTKKEIHIYLVYNYLSFNNISNSAPLEEMFTSTFISEC